MAKLMAQMEYVNSAQPASTSASASSTPGAAGAAGGKAPAPANPFARPPVFLTLKPNKGIHDMYFVFKNDQAKTIQPLMSLGTIKFLNSDK